MCATYEKVCYWQNLVHVSVPDWDNRISPSITLVDTRRCVIVPDLVENGFEESLIIIFMMYLYKDWVFAAEYFDLLAVLFVSQI